VERLPANADTYTDNPPHGGPHWYAVEAYNQDASLAKAAMVVEGRK